MNGGNQEIGKLFNQVGLKVVCDHRVTIESLVLGTASLVETLDVPGIVILVAEIGGRGIQRSFFTWHTVRLDVGIHPLDELWS